MKFGKRFAQAQGQCGGIYLDYKALKQSLKHDCTTGDWGGTQFEETLAKQLSKVGEYYSKQEGYLRSALNEIQGMPLRNVGEPLCALRKDVQELTNYAALNYVAVLKAVKKRNRRLRDACGDRVVNVSPFSILQHQKFFNSKELSKIFIAAAEIEVKLEHNPSYEGLTRDCKCPICQQVLQAPVLLGCAHTFCWGCLTMYCLGVLQSPSIEPQDKAIKSQQTNNVAPAKMTQLGQGWAPQGEDTENRIFACPVCRKEQILDLDNLTVDRNISALAEQEAKQASSSRGSLPSSSKGSLPSSFDSLPAPNSKQGRPDSKSRHQETASLSTESLAAASDAQPSSVLSSSDCFPTSETLLPPQLTRWRGKLTVVLDLDGTLIASFPPRRAPQLPSHMRTHLVGAGSSLNPQGVFVVERPGLPKFLSAVAELAELAIFTAGLPEYALPIIEAIDPGSAFFGDRIICRGGTSAAPEYPCVKDMSRIGRPLSHALIIDDTPLAFLWQPTNGVPVLGFRGDPEDNLLLDAVLPLLRNAAAAPDVRPFLDKRFAMSAWFTSHGYMTQPPASRSAASTPSSASSPSAPAAIAPDASHAAVASFVAQRTPAMMPRGGTLLLCDFDKTIVDFDVMERITESLAIELLPMLVAFQSPEDFVPVMNAVLEEMRRRSVSHGALIAELVALGSKFPGKLATLLRAARSRGLALRVLSNCNTLFIREVLKGAKLEDTFHDIMSNEATVQHPSSRSSSTAQPRVVVRPCQAPSASHHCCYCPAALCKGMHVRAMQAHHSKIVFCGDGANDLCAVLSLRPQDVAFVRSSYKCDSLLKERGALGNGVQQPECSVRRWGTQSDLAEMLHKELKI